MLRRTFARHWKVILLSAAIALASLYILVSTNTFAAEMNTDSGIFAYCGQRILDGDLLYRDCFDNKPPAIYYLNALILVLFGPNPFGIWWFQAAWMAGTGVLLFLLIRRLWGGWAGFFATLIFLFTAQQPAYYSGGNLTETYNLAVQVLTFWALWGALKWGRDIAYLEIGFLTALAFLLKPTYVMVGAAAGLTALLASLVHDRSGHGLRLAARRSAWMLAGLFLPLLAVAAYFAARGGLDDLIFAVFIEPRSYVQAGFAWYLVKDVFQLFLFAVPIALLTSLTLAAAGVFLYETVRRFKPPARPLNPAANTGGTGEPWDSSARWVLFAALLSVPLDIFLAGLSGRQYGHYYLVPMPAMALCAGYFFSRVESGLRRHEGAGITAVVALAVLCIPWANFMFQQAQTGLPNLRAFLSSPPLGAYQLSELEQYIHDHSGPDEAVLVLSPHPSINLLSERRTPTRYIFPPHLLGRVPSGPNGLPELVDELRADPPALVVFQQGSSANIPDFRAEGDALCGGCSPELRAGMLGLKSFIAENYVFDIQIWDFFLYRRTQ